MSPSDYRVKLLIIIDSLPKILRNELFNYEYI